MARAQTWSQRDFTGGLNLRSDQFQLGDNESPEILNMDIDPRGGIRTRRGFTPYATPTGLPGEVISLWSFNKLGVDPRLCAQVHEGGQASAVYNLDGGSWSKVGTDNTTLDPVSQFTFKDVLYVGNGTDLVLRWAMPGVSRLNGNLTSNDFDNPTTGNMPIGRCMTVFNGHVFVGNTTEGAGTRYPNRLRFSHPNFPEAYRAVDYIDVDPGVDGDEIVALVPYGDQLLIFKNHSVHVLMGYGWDSWSVQTVSNVIGAATPRSVVSSPLGVYFVDWPGGVYHWNGRQLSNVSTNIRPVFDAEPTPSGSWSTGDDCVLHWVRERLWVVVKDVTYVMDPSLAKGQGSWTKYDLRPYACTRFHITNDEPVWLAATPSGGEGLVRLESPDADADEPNDGTGDRNAIPTVYTTPWVDVGDIASRKRFKRPWFVFHGNATDRVKIEVFRNLDSSSPRKTFYESVSESTSGATWDDGVAEWDDGVTTWAAERSSHEIERGSTLGLARAVQLRFVGPFDTSNPAQWGLNNITYVFIRKAVR